MTFTFRRGIREQTPLLLGFVGPTWTGKTYSALRVGTGIVKVRGGKLVGIDTEARRMLQYANEFQFSYTEFGPPFSSLRYSDAMKDAAVEAAGGCVIVDSQSHEHEGAGGYLDFQQEEVKRLCRDGGFKSEFSAQIPAWAKPSQQRRVLINTILQLNCAFIFCFRAKEKIKPVKGGSPLELGWQAIAGEEFGYEMTARCLLKPGAKGVPDWSEDAEKLGVPKRIKDHAEILRDGRQLDEAVGEGLARWSAGGKKLDGDSSAEAGYITPDQLIDLEDKIKMAKLDAAKLCKAAGVARLAMLPVADGYQRSLSWIAKQSK